MNLRLGIRLLRGGGRKGAVRLVLIVGGTGLGVFFLLLALVVPQILRDRQERGAFRQPDSLIEGERATFLYAPLQRRFGTTLVSGFLLAPAEGAPAPPGVSRLPEAGQAVVSPELKRLLDTQPGLRTVFEFEPAGVIGSAGLAAPNEVFAWIAVAGRDLPGDAHPSGHYGTGWEPIIDMPESALRLLGLGFLGLTGLPLGVYFAVCARLSAATRDRRLAALRLLGMSVRDTALVSAVESTTAALAGSSLGLVLYLITRVPLARLGVAGIVWFPDEAMPSLADLLIVLGGVPALAAILSRVSARPVVRDALAVRRQIPSPHRRGWRILVLSSGLGLMVGLLLTAMRLPNGVGFGSRAQLFLVVALIWTGLGLAVSVGVLAEMLAGALARRTLRLWLLLGARRLELESGSGSRVVAGLVVVVFGMGFAVGLSRDAGAAASPVGSREQYSVHVADVPTGSRGRLWDLPSTQAAAVKITSAISSSHTPGQPPGPETIGVVAAFANCSDFAAFVGGSLPGCVDGLPYRVVVRGGPPPLVRLEPGRVLRYPTKVQRHSPTFGVRVPARTLLVPPSGQFAADLLLPPGDLPGGIPDTADFYLLSSTDAAAVNQVSAELAALAPAALIAYQNDNLEARLQTELFQRLLRVALALGMLVGLTAFVVASIDHGIERRADLVALRVAGAPIRLLRAAQAAQVGSQLVIGMALAIGCGKLAEQVTVAGGGIDRSWTWSDLVGALVLGVLAVALGTLTTTAAVAGEIDPSLIRRE